MYVYEIAYSSGTIRDNKPAGKRPKTPGSYVLLRGSMFVYSSSQP